MRWKASTNSEAGEVLRLLARQGEPLLKHLDNGKAIGPLKTIASNDEALPEAAAEPVASANGSDNGSDTCSDSEEPCNPVAVAR